MISTETGESKRLWNVTWLGEKAVSHWLRDRADHKLGVEKNLPRVAEKMGVVI